MSREPFYLGKQTSFNLHRPTTNLNLDDLSISQLNHSPATANNMASVGEQYHPKDAVKAAITGTMVTGSAGALVSAIQNSLSKRNVGAWGIFTRTGSTIGIFGTLYTRVGIRVARD